MTMFTRRPCATTLCITLMGVMAIGSTLHAAPDAKSILRAADVSGGLVVHVGCGDGRLTAALRVSDSIIVHGLDPDAANVAAARTHVESLGLTGKVSVAQLAGSRLPYIDNLVRLVVADDLGAVAMAEVLRVLAPNGVAVIGGKKTVKPRPGNIGEWTHYLRDASGNAVALDTVVAPPRHVQWMAAPEWSRNHHKLASISSVVTAAGRIFYIMDSATSADMSVPGKWSLVARDAFSGVKLWSKSMASWAYHLQGFRSGPVQLPRTLVASARRVYAPLELNGAVSALDAQTGEILRTYKQTAGAEELILAGDVLLVLAGSPQAEHAALDPKRRGQATGPTFKTIHAIRPETGETLWKWSDTNTGGIMPVTLSAADGRAFVEVGRGVICFDLTSGKQVWTWNQQAATAPPAPKAAAAKAGAGGKKKKPARSKKPHARRGPGWSTATLVIDDGVVLLADGGTLQALAAKDGKPLWDSGAKAGFKSPADVFVIGGLVWQGPSFAEGRDLHTGEIKRTNTAQQDIWTVGHHHRCYREKATSKYVMTSYRGIEFLDVFGEDHTRNNWIRGVCQYGVMPANGLIYAPSHACGCFMEAQLLGFWAVAPERKAAPPAAQGPELTKGPAFGKIPKSEIRNPQSEWPTYRQNPLRSASTTATLPAALKDMWQTKIGGRLSAPVVAEGIVLVASIDTHRIVALDASTGKQKWSHTAGGRVDSPPTIHKGLVLFGSADGYVTCLAADDGRMAWRFRVAPRDENTVALDQVESVWPVHGSVLVENDMVYTAAGRSSYLDGGIRVVALDPATGRKLYESTLATGHPKVRNRAEAAAETKIPIKKFTQNATDHKTFTDPDRSDAFSMDGTTTDVMVSNGTSIFLRTIRLDRQCVEQAGDRRHLLSTSRLIDDAENHRSHVVLGTGDFSRTPVAYSWIANGGGSRWGANLSVPYGVMLTFDENNVWGIARPGRGGSEYRLFLQPNTPFAPSKSHLPDFRPPNSEGSAVVRDKWTVQLPLRPRAMVRAGEMIFIAGTSGGPADDPHAAFEGRTGGLLRTLSAADGTVLAQRQLDSSPVWDGLAAANGRMVMVTTDGRVICMDRNDSPPPVPAGPTPTKPKPAGSGNKTDRRGKPANGGAGPKGSPGKPVAADDKGIFVLTPAAARTTGGLRYQADRNNLGSWSNPAATCSWTLKGAKAGKYTVEFAYGTTRAGVGYTLIAADQTLAGKTRNTGGMKTYKAYPIGTLTLPAGQTTLTVKPDAFTGGAIMNYRLITLTPVK